MNTARVAALLRELADELERDERHAGKPNVPKSAPRRPVRKPYVPDIQLTEIDRARARRRARKMGIPIP